VRKRPYPPVTAGFVVLMAFFGLGISACLRTEGGRKAELRERAEELVPPDARILVISYGDCVELASSPSCARVVFEMAERDPAVRAALVRAEAEGQGWTVTHSDDAQGGWSVYAKRGGFRAVVFLWRPDAYDVDCRDRPDPRSESEEVCFNTLNVER
jgi:hypothetical protein